MAFGLRGSPASAAAYQLWNSSIGSSSSSMIISRPSRTSARRRYKPHISRDGKMSSASNWRGRDGAGASRAFRYQAPAHHIGSRDGSVVTHGH